MQSLSQPLSPNVVKDTMRQFSSDTPLTQVGSHQPFPFCALPPEKAIHSLCCDLTSPVPLIPRYIYLCVAVSFSYVIWTMSIVKKRLTLTCSQDPSSFLLPSALPITTMQCNFPQTRKTDPHPVLSILPDSIPSVTSSEKSCS